MAQAKRDQNFVPTLLAVSSMDGSTPTTVYADPTTHRLLVDIGGFSSALQTDTFTSTNNQTTFTPSLVPAGTIYLSVNGSIQTPATDYSFTGGSYVLSSGIPAGCSVIACYVTS